jgi:hypothetical protein
MLRLPLRFCIGSPPFLPHSATVTPVSPAFSMLCAIARDDITVHALKS